MQHVDHACAAHARRIVDSSLVESEMFFKLFGARLSKVEHVILRAKMQTSRRARLDACRLQSFIHAIGTQRALEHFLRAGVELRNIEGASAYAVAAANTVRLLKVDDAIGILNDRPIRRTSFQATGIGAVHALILAHEQHGAAIVALVLIELDKVPVVPCRFWHGLVAVVEGSVSKGVAIPFQAGYFAGLAADTRGSVDQLADLFGAFDICTRRRPGMT